MSNLNQYIKKSHLRMVERFNADLEAFREYTGDDAAVLYEDAFTSFTLANVRVENGCLKYEYDGKLEQEAIVLQDEDTKEYYEEEYDGILIRMLGASNGKRTEAFRKPMMLSVDKLPTSMQPSLT